MLFPAFWNLLKQTTVNRVFTIPQIVKFSSYAYISANCWDRWWSKGIYSLLEFIQTKDEKSLLAKKRNLFQTLVWVEVRDESQHTQLSCSLKVWTDAAIIGMRRNGMNGKKKYKTKHVQRRQRKTGISIPFRYDIPGIFACNIRRRETRIRRCDLNRQ